MNINNNFLNLSNPTTISLIKEDSTFLSIIIPAYNEEKRLPVAFQEIEKYFSANTAIKTEVIFVDDGSDDNTKEVIKKFINKQLNQKIRLTSYQPNRGKGFAVKTGILAANGDYALMVDADMSTSLDELNKFLPFIYARVPIVIGTRKDCGAFLIKKQPWCRQKMGELYAFLARLATGVKIKDFGCGFKIFSKEASQKIFPLTIINRWTFDTEILFLAKKYGYQIKEVGILWSNNKDTRVNIIRDALLSIYDLLRMRIHHRK